MLWSDTTDKPAQKRPPPKGNVIKLRLVPSPLIRHPACVRRRMPPSPRGRQTAAAGTRASGFPLGKLSSKQTDEVRSKTRALALSLMKLSRKGRPFLWCGHGDLNPNAKGTRHKGSVTSVMDSRAVSFIPVRFSHGRRFSPGKNHLPKEATILPEVYNEFIDEFTN